MTNALVKASLDGVKCPFTVSYWVNISFCPSLYKVALVNCVLWNFLQPIVSLSFVGKSEYLVSTSWESKPQLSVWSLSKLSMSWSYRLHVEGKNPLSKER